MKTVTVHERAVKKIRNFYLWVYADEVAARPSQSYPGEVVAVAAPDGELLGTAFHHPTARVALRLFSRREVMPDAAFWRDRLARALGRRQPLREITDGLRLVYAEGDYLPGLVVDDYAGHLVAQFRTAGMDLIKPLLVELLGDLCQPVSIYERSDVQSRREEDLPLTAGPLRGATPDRVEIRENGLRFRVDIREGQKTGFYLDMRDIRKSLAAFAGPGTRFLDAFSYSGGCGLYAAAAGAAVTAVDKDERALALVRENAALNGLAARVTAVSADAFRWLPAAVEAGEKFDVISLDPPSLIKYKNQQGRGRGMLLDLIRPCLQMLPPGGILHVASCAYHVLPDLLKEAVRMAAGDAGVRLLVVAETVQAADHPYLLQMPETLYLKGYTLQVAID